MRRLFSALASTLPRSLLRRWLRWATRDLCLALCFHRVNGGRPATDSLPEHAIAPAILAELLAALTDEKKQAPSQLFFSFDDGYAEAAAFIARHAPLHPSVRWLFFVCPEKIERRAGFRWDLFATAAESPGDRDGLDAFLGRDQDIEKENLRPELQKLADSETFGLASVAQCAQLAKIENVALGNHTNCHFRLTDLAPSEAERELRSSTETFEKLFGPCRHLAFPFGKPGHDFTADHVRMTSGIHPMICWSTEQRPFRPDELDAGAAVPRFTLHHFRDTNAMLAKICVLSSVFRVRTFISDHGPRTAVQSAKVAGRPKRT